MIDAAIVLAAGLGTRLAPLSAVRAKAALPVAGEPMLRRQIRWLAAAGVRHVVVNLHHLPATVTRLVGHGDDLGVDVRYSWEPVVLGSGGGPARAFELLDADRAYIVNGDTLTDLDLAALAAAHDAGGAAVTLAAVHGDVRRYNALLVDAGGALSGIAAAGSEAAVHAPGGAQAVHFIGVQVAERAAFAGVSPDLPSESLRHVYPALLARRPASVRVRISDATFDDIGTPADYLRTVEAVAARESGVLDRGAGTEIAPGAWLDRVVCWDDVQVGAGARLTRCILADGVHVPPGTALRDVAVVRHDAGAPRPGDLVIGELVASPLVPAGGHSRG